MIVLMAGLPGSGKSTLARELAVRTSGRVIGKDEIRHALFPDAEIEYSSRQDDFCMEIMLQVAGYVLRQNSDRMIFLDGRTFSRRYQIENALSFAESVNQTWRILECICSEESVKKHLQEHAMSGSHPADNRDVDLYLNIRNRFETIVHPKLQIDTDQPLEACVQKAHQYLACRDKIQQ